ncbi:MAG: hypothetical protein SV487_11375, partial [Thermodesulfobacteriota bacterium]|nr:hypothetical protein [Thermodesulfobacteriota bacterium]
ELRAVADRIKNLGLDINEPAVEKRIKVLLQSLFKRLAYQPDNLIITRILAVLEMYHDLGLSPDLWEIQNTFYGLFSGPDFMGRLSPELLVPFQKIRRALGFCILGESYDEPGDGPALPPAGR